jgi:hypothetical protein
MAEKPIGTPGSQSLLEFQTVVQQNEEIFGPLKALGKQGNNNTMTFEIGSSPATPAILATYDSDPPPAKAEHSIICKGDCLVEGKNTKVAAYRKIKTAGQ